MHDEQKHARETEVLSMCRELKKSGTGILKQRSCWKSLIFSHRARSPWNPSCTKLWWVTIVPLCIAFVNIVGAARWSYCPGWWSVAADLIYTLRTRRDIKRKSDVILDGGEDWIRRGKEFWCFGRISISTKSFMAVRLTRTTAGTPANWLATRSWSSISRTRWLLTRTALQHQYR